MATTPPATPGDPNAFNQGHDESFDPNAASNGNDEGVTVIAAPQPAGQDPNQPQPSQAPVGPDGQRLFTAEDIEKARREEKEKLYGTIEELKGKVGELSEAEKARLAAEEARVKAEQEAQRKAEEAEMSAKELIEKREAEWKAQMEEQSKQVLTLQEQIQQQNAVMEQERQFQELQSYRAQRIEQEANDIMPHLRGMVSGNSPEEIEQSIAQLKQTSAAIMQDMTQAQATEAPRLNQRGTSVTMPPVGPMDTQSAQRTITPEDIANMSPTEYAQHRDSLLAATSRQVRERGLYQ